MYWILSNEFVDEDNDADLTGDINLDLGDEISFDEQRFTGEFDLGLDLPVNLPPGQSIVSYEKITQWRYAT